MYHLCSIIIPYAVVEIESVMQRPEVRRNSGFNVIDPGTRFIITAVVESSSCFSVGSCDSCPSVQWTLNGVNITTGMDYTVSDPCSDGMASSDNSPFTFTLTVVHFAVETSGNYSAVFSYLSATAMVEEFPLIVESKYSGAFIIETPSSKCYYKVQITKYVRRRV